MENYLGWQIRVEFLGLQGYSFQAQQGHNTFACPEVFRSWEDASEAAEHWVQMNVAYSTMANALDKLRLNETLSLQEYRQIVSRFANGQVS